MQLALSFYGLEQLEGGQPGIEGFFGTGSVTGGQNPAGVKRRRSMSPAIKIAGSVARKATSDSETKKQKQKQKQQQNEIIEILTDSDEDVVEHDDSRWTCPKCRHVFSVNGDDALVNVDKEATKAKLDAIKREHEDFHLAKELHHQERRETKSDNRKASAPTHKKIQRKPPAKPEGIKAFFSPFDDERTKRG